MKKIFNLMALILLTTILIACAGDDSGGSTPPLPPAEPNYDMSGVWDISYSGVGYINSHPDAECGYLYELVLYHIKEDTEVELVQYDRQFSLVFLSTGEAYNGTITTFSNDSKDIYNIEEASSYLMEGYDVREEMYASLTAISPDNFAGSLEYDIHMEGYGYICHLEYTMTGHQQ